MPPNPLPDVNPSSLAGAMKEAARLHRAGRLTEAIALYRQITKTAPKAAEVHNNLAAALKAAGKLREAQASYRRAIKIRPNYSVAKSNLGALLIMLGKAEEGLDYLAQAYLEELKERSSATTARDRLLVNLSSAMPPRAGRTVRRALEQLARDPTIETQALAHPGAVLLRHQGPIKKALRQLDGDARLNAKSLPQGIFDALTTPLPMALFSEALIADAQLETLFTALRRLWLDQASHAAGGALPPDDLLAGLGLQAFASEWVWNESEEEREQVDTLIERLSDREPKVDAPLLCVALYRSLGSLPKTLADAFHDLVPTLADGPVRDLLTRHLVEPRAEAALAADLPNLTSITEDTSLRVQAQYEANAYPRWRRLPPHRSQTLADVLHNILPGAPLTEPLAKAPNILVAGCGTGRHALSTATRYSDATVLAIDLSLASLGFAARQARDLGIDNITFAQADILGLGALEQRFDLIECSGTLHHMADPEAGWRTLRGLQAPRGLMRISLYSAHARKDIVAMRDVIAREGWEPTPAGIRKAREIWRAPGDGQPMPPFVETPDFYSISGCRDLLFHEQEVQFDLPRIARDLSDLDLTFLGFEHPNDSIRQAFRQEHPDPEALRDLTAWDAFEAENPMIFAAMYQFWCQASGTQE